MENNMYDLTNPQRSIWLTEMYFKGLPINNICGSVIIKQDVNLELLNTAINYFIKNNDSFKTRITLKDEKPMQYFIDDTNYNFEVLKIKNPNEIEAFAKEEVNTPFNILDSKLFNFKLFKLDCGFGGFIINAHHIISDAATLSILCSEIANNYSKLLKNEPIPDKQYSYIDYIKSEQQYLASNRFEKDKEYWKKSLSPLPEVATFLPQKSQLEENYASKRTEFIFETELLTKINNYCTKNNISIFNFLIGVYSIYFGKINNIENFLLGTPVLNRTKVSEKNTSGMFINTSLLKIDMSNNITFKEFAKQIATDTLSVFRHQKYNYQYILNDIREIDSSIPNLYDVMLSFQVTKATDNTVDIPYSTKWYGTDYISNTLNIHFHDNDNTGNLLCEYDYQVSKIQENEIAKMHNRILTIIHQILDNSSIYINSIDIVTDEEKKLLLFDLNNTYKKIPENKTIIELFEEQVKRTPNKIAIIFNNTKLTYSELNKKANKLAHYIRSNNNITPNTTIGLLSKRSIEMAIGLLAILKTGAAYIPIDPEYPVDRISYMLEDSNTSILLVNIENDLQINANTIINLKNINTNLLKEPDSNLSLKIDSESLMYLIYTSGSTGKPKGVMLTNKNVVNYLYGLYEEINFTQEKTMVSVTTICFDIFVTEFWGSLLHGLTLVIANEKEQNIPYDLNKLCKKYKVNMLQTTPSRFSMLISENQISFLKSITDLMLGGEALPKNVLSFLNSFSNFTVYNMYGPTETTVWSTIKKQPVEESITIGTPIANTQVYILNNNLNLLPPNVPGNLYIGGKGVSRGYHNKLDLTQKVFIKSPFDNSTIYNTKDLAYRRTDGEIIHLGRTDFQAKVHGYRVELGEIEQSLISYPNIKDAVVLFQNGTLNAFVICDTFEEAFSVRNIKTYLLTLLPQYMVPKKIIRLDSFPLTPNGKINRKSSIFNVNYKSEVSSEKIQPRNKLEQLLFDVLKENTSQEIGITDNFFEYGLDSLMIIKMVSTLYSYNINLSIQDFYTYTSIESLAKRITTSPTSPQIDNIDISNYTDLSVFKKKIKNPPSVDKGIFLTGTTGFLGIHILKELLDKTDLPIYCPLRPKAGKTPKERLIEQLEFYFNGKYINLIEKRIFVINCSITQNHFGLSNKAYTAIGNNVSCVIHSAADVRHFGNYNVSRRANVQSTENLINFCLEFNLVLNHISTLTVSGYGLVDVPYDEKFTENSFYVNQNYQENIYVKSKLIAESKIFNALKLGLVSNIYRIGTLTNRFSDGMYQQNTYDNAFLNKLRTIKNFKKVPLNMKDMLLDLTPVDLAATAITKLALFNTMKYNLNIYHLYNNNLISISNFVKILQNNSINIEYENYDNFKKDIMTNAKNSKEMSGFLDQFYISRDIPAYKEFFSCKKSLNVLKSLDFTWPKLTTEYLNNILNNL